MGRKHVRRRINGLRRSFVDLGDPTRRRVPAQRPDASDRALAPCELRRDRGPDHDYRSGDLHKAVGAAFAAGRAESWRRDLGVLLRTVGLQYLQYRRLSAGRDGGKEIMRSIADLGLVE